MLKVRFAVALLVLCVLLWHQSLAQEDYDEYALLFQPRLLFEGQIPKVSIALMENQEEVTFNCPEGLKLKLRSSVKKEAFFPRGGRFKVEAREVQKAEAIYRPVVGSASYGNAEKREDIAQQWKQRGYDVNFFLLGTVFGIKGKVIDHRRYLATAGGFKSEREANAEAQKLYKKFGVKPSIHKELVKLPKGTLTITDLAGQAVEQSENMIVISSYGSASPDITVEGVEHGVGYSWHGREDRNYRGEIRIVLDSNAKLAVINVVSLEELLKGLVPSEIYSRASLEALKAQAVVARGEVLAKIGVNHISDPYVLCASQHCQVYSGKSRETPSTDRAVEETAGYVLVSGGRIVDSVYSSNCGGHTEDNETVWPNFPNPSLRGKPDLLDGSDVPEVISSKNVRQFLASRPKSFCNLSSYNRADKFRWKTTFTAERVTALVNRKYNVGEVRDMKIAGRGRGGRVKALKIVGEKDSAVVLQELAIRKLFDNLNSGLFVLEMERDQNGAPVAFTFSGAGWGHGVGMCQTGAIGMAEQGYSFVRILKHYYSGAEVVKIY